MVLKSPLPHWVKSPYLVPFSGGISLKKTRTDPPKGTQSKQELRSALSELTDMLDDLQRRLFAEARHAVLIHFQGMDASGKDGAIRAVMGGIDPAGCLVSSFKKPSLEELAHDFLWRTSVRLPERGKVGIFNRGYYEEVLIVRLHPEWLEAQKLPKRNDLKALFEERFESILDHEKHLARNGTLVLKFFLHLSKDEQQKRFLARLENPRKHWKFSEADLTERSYWNAYMDAYQDIFKRTSTPWAPWYVVPSDNKPFMWVQIADTLVRTLQSLNLDYPRFNPAETRRFEALKRKLIRQG